jgi:streptogramin lyase
VGGDGNLWFTDFHTIGRITPAGRITEFRAGITGKGMLWEIAAGPDGNLWFTEPEDDRIGRVDLRGSLVPRLRCQASCRLEAARSLARARRSGPRSTLRHRGASRNCPCNDGG